MPLPLFIRSHHSRRRIPSIKQARHLRRFRLVLPTLSGQPFELPIICDEYDRCGVDQEDDFGHGGGGDGGDESGGIGLDEAYCNTLFLEIARNTCRAHTARTIASNLSHRLPIGLL